MRVPARASAAASLGSLYPKSYRLWIEGPELAKALSRSGAAAADAGPLLLSFAPETSTQASGEWRLSCAQRGEWSLRVTHLDNGRVGTLTCSSLGRSLPAPLIWRKERFEVTGANRLAPRKPLELVERGLTCLVEPV